MNMKIMLDSKLTVHNVKVRGKFYPTTGHEGPEE
jgi:hypothetical protein